MTQIARHGGPGSGIPDSLKNFDLLPDDGFVRLPVVIGLLGVSPATAWRMVRRGAIPPPVKLSPGVSAWNVGGLRSALRGRV